LNFQIAPTCSVSFLYHFKQHSSYQSPGTTPVLWQTGERNNWLSLYVHLYDISFS